MLLAPWVFQKFLMWPPLKKVWTPLLYPNQWHTLSLSLSLSLSLTQYSSDERERERRATLKYRSKNPLTSCWQGAESGAEVKKNVGMDLSMPLVISLNIIKSFYSFRSSRGPAGMTNAVENASFSPSLSLAPSLGPVSCQESFLLLCCVLLPKLPLTCF